MVCCFECVCVCVGVIENGGMCRSELAVESGWKFESWLFQYSYIDL